MSANSKFFGAVRAAAALVLCSVPALVAQTSSSGSQACIGSIVTPGTGGGSGSSNGSFAASINGTNVVIVGFDDGAGVGFNLSAPLANDGTFQTTTTALNADGSMGQTLTISGTVSGGTVSGTIAELGVNFTGSLDSSSGPTSSNEGYYSAPALNSAGGGVYSIVGTQSEIYSLAVTPSAVFASSGAINSDGSFATEGSSSGSVVGNLNLPMISGTVTLSDSSTLSFTAPVSTAAATNQIVNLSGLGTVNGTASPLETGFEISGSGTKTLLLRAIGPGLVTYGITGTVVAPQITLLDANGNVVTTAGAWGGTADLTAAFNSVGAFSLDPASADAALVVTLPAGGYTLQVTDSTGATGTVLAEVYDLDGASSPRLTNGSSLGSVSANSGLVNGFVVDGNAPETVLIRGVGPSLADFGISNAASATSIAVSDSNGNLIASNSGWQTPTPVRTQQVAASAPQIMAAAASAGAFPLVANSMDSAVLVTLAPGSYTVQVNGANGSTGSALLEIYEIAQ